MKKVVIIILLLIICFVVFLIFNKKENIERCLIAYIDKDNQFQQIYIYDITYSGLIDKKVSKIATTKEITFFKPDENITNEHYNDYKMEGENYKTLFPEYTYDLSLETDKNVSVVFKSNLSLKNDNLENLSSTEYNQTLDSKGNMNFNKVKKYYQNQGAICKNIKKFQ